MKLFYTPSSCYARKVRVMARELGLTDRIEEVRTTLRNPDSDLLPYNPVGRVPTLEGDDGLILTESAIICRYLDTISDGCELIPETGPEHWRVMLLEGKAQGFMEGIAYWVRELRRPENERSPDFIKVERQRAERVLADFEHEMSQGAFDKGPDIAQITLACTLPLIDEFLADLKDWRSSCPKMAAWYEGFSKRSSMIATEPERG